MTANELIQYIETNKLEYQMVDILLFNDFQFDFIPVFNPKVAINNMDCSLLDGDELNLLSSDYQLPSFRLTEELLPSNWNRYVNHPEHLSAYIVRHINSVFGEFIYNRGSNASIQIRNEAFEDFIQISGISNINDFNKLARRASSIRRNRYRKGFGDKNTIKYVDLLIDKRVFDSLMFNHEDPELIIQMYSIRLFEAEKRIYNDRYISIDNSLILPENTESVISFFAEFIPIDKNKTPLDQDVSIIDKDDHISNILYQIAIETNANTFFAATGYAYESGIRMLLPAITCVRGNNKPHSIELIIGDLKNYKNDVKQKSMNRATASKLNWMKDSYLLDHLYTYPNAFYHGKFYYISNGKITYVIIGSSNITESAYSKNRELDLIFRFQKEGDEISEQEQMFYDWYINLRKNSIELHKLNETLFKSNLYIDEANNSYGSSILRELTSEEEKERFRFLEDLNPSQINGKIFSQKKEFKAFQHYIAFYYPEKNLSIIESFRYGNSCFILGTTDEERIKLELSRKSKEQVRQSDIYISNVNHDEYYQSEIRRIFSI